MSGVGEEVGEEVTSVSGVGEEVTSVSGVGEEVGEEVTSVSGVGEEVTSVVVWCRSLSLMGLICLYGTLALSSSPGQPG